MSSSVTSALSTVTVSVSKSGSSNFGLTSTSAVNDSSLPSSSWVISTSGWPRTNTSASCTALL